MSNKMIVTFYRKEITWFGYKVKVDAKTNEEAMKKIKDYDYEKIETVDEEYDGLEETMSLEEYQEFVKNKESDNAN